MAVDPGPIPSGRERILIVDDEQTLVEIMDRSLKKLGYSVTATTSSNEALECFRERAEEFDLVITDQTMPGMTGDKLARELLKIRPDIPIILTTGFSEVITAEKAMQIGIREFIMKPLVIREMARAIRRALND